MDHESFDRLARILGRAGSRRTALGALVGAGVAGAAAGVDAKNKKKGRGSKKSRGKKGVRAQVQPGLKDCPVFGKGQNLSKCDFKDRDMRGANISGSNAAGSDFENANLCGANLQRANLGKTDFTNANLTRVDLKGANTGSWNTAGATFCQTRMPNKLINNTDCPGGGGTICCDDSECPAETPVCVDGACTECSDSDQCPASEPVCDNGACICPTECCVDGQCTEAAEPTCDNGTCVCTEECCVDAQCPDLELPVTGIEVQQICQGDGCCVANTTIIGTEGSGSGGCSNFFSLNASVCCSGVRQGASLLCRCVAAP